jgi:hypothetical protein
VQCARLTHGRRCLRVSSATTQPWVAAPALTTLASLDALADLAAFAAIAALAALAAVLAAYADPAALAILVSIAILAGLAAFDASAECPTGSKGEAGRPRLGFTSQNREA